MRRNWMQGKKIGPGSKRPLSNGTLSFLCCRKESLASREQRGRGCIPCVRTRLSGYKHDQPEPREVLQPSWAAYDHPVRRYQREPRVISVDDCSNVYVKHCFVKLYWKYDYLQQYSNCQHMANNDRQSSRGVRGVGLWPATAATGAECSSFYGTAISPENRRVDVESFETSHRLSTASTSMYVCT